MFWHNTKIYQKIKGERSTCRATEPSRQRHRAGRQDSEVPYNLGTFNRQPNLCAMTLRQNGSQNPGHNEYVAHLATQQQILTQFTNIKLNG